MIPEHYPTKRFRLVEKISLQIQMLEHDPVAEVEPTSADHALDINRVKT